MYYFFNINGAKTQCFYNDMPAYDKSHCGTMTVYDNDGEVTTIPVLANNDGRRYFVFNDELIMFDNHYCYTPEELIKNINRVRDYQLCQTLLKYGMDSIRVMRNILDFDHRHLGKKFNVEEQLKNGIWIEYRFQSEYLHDPKDNYKLLLVPANKKDVENYASWRTYVCDMVSLFANRPDLYQLKANTTN